MYLTYGTRPDIAFAIRQLSKYNANPRRNYLQIAKKVVQYLKKIMQLGLVYSKKPNTTLPRDPPPYGLLGYTNSNFAGDLKDWKSVIGYCFFLNRVVIS